MNGLNITISEMDFKAKAAEDRDWMLLAAVLKIDKDGCQWGKRGHQFNKLSTLIAMSGAFGAALGCAIGVWQFLSR